MERRKFIKTSCTMCVGLAAGISALTMLESCATGKIVTQEIIDNKITVLKSEFNAEKPNLIIRTKTLTYDILVHQNTDNTFNAFYMQCTHYDNPVYSNGKEIFCPSHGSKFDYKGNATKEPASLPLKQYPITINDNHIIISIPKD